MTYAAGQAGSRSYGTKAKDLIINFGIIVVILLLLYIAINMMI